MDSPQIKKKQTTMPRIMLTDEQWYRLHSLMLKSGRVYNKSEHRMTLEGILDRMRTG
ncbi:transposase [Yersinia pestis]|nr:transposase [Yersinia pestis]